MSRQFRQARKTNHLKLTETAQKLGVSQPTLSAWENERKSPSLDGLERMADLYNVSTDYLLGRAGPDAGAPSIPVSLAALPVFHGKPVWSAEHGWMLVNAACRMLLCLDGQTLPFGNVRQVYASPMLFAEPALPSAEPLGRQEVPQRECVWVEPISPDAELRAELRGWYHVKDRFVQNEFGNRFYLDTYEAKWLAFERGE